MSLIHCLISTIFTTTEEQREAQQGYETHATYRKIEPIQTRKREDKGSDHRTQGIPCKSP
jgi:hypothetical protein